MSELECFSCENKFERKDMESRMIFGGWQFYCLKCSELFGVAAKKKYRPLYVNKLNNEDHYSQNICKNCSFRKWMTDDFWGGVGVLWCSVLNMETSNEKYLLDDQKTTVVESICECNFYKEKK